MVEHLWHARFPRVGSNLMAVVETEYGGAVHVRGRVRGGGHSGVPSYMAAPAAGRADRCESSPTSTEDGNQPTIALAKNSVLQDQSKHIDVKFHFLRDCVDGRQIVIEFVELIGNSRTSSPSRSVVFGSRS